MKHLKHEVKKVCGLYPTVVPVFWIDAQITSSLFQRGLCDEAFSVTIINCILTIMFSPASSSSSTARFQPFLLLQLPDCCRLCLLTPLAGICVPFCSAAYPVPSARAVDRGHTDSTVQCEVCELRWMRGRRQVDGGDGGLWGGAVGIFSLPAQPVAFQAFWTGLPRYLHLLTLCLG